MALAVAALVACEKSAPYEPGAPMNLDNPNVYFSAYNSAKTVLASDATEFEVALLRDDVETALTLPLKSACSYEGIFTVPESVTFPAGVDSVSFKVQVSDKVEMFQNYHSDAQSQGRYGENAAPQCSEARENGRCYNPQGDGIRRAGFSVGIRHSGRDFHTAGIAGRLLV